MSESHPLIPDYQDAEFARLKRRHRKESFFKFYGSAAVVIAGIFLMSLLYTILSDGLPAFQTTEIKADVYLDPNKIPADDISTGNFNSIAKSAIRDLFPNVTSRSERRKLGGFISGEAARQIEAYVLRNPNKIGEIISLWLPASSTIDMVVKGHIEQQEGVNSRRFSDQEFSWFNELKAEERIRTTFNYRFFENADSRDPELAGIKGAFTGSLFIVLICLAVAFPIGVAAAVYLEEFAPKNRFTDLIEINLNNLAAVPSIVYGLLGFFVFLHVFGMPRSSSLVGGLTLALLVLPIIVIASRTALASVPSSIRLAAIGLGASPVQVVMHHTLPAALPGIMTGTILAIARALGETAPLLMIGMVAFIATAPETVMSPATALPVQIYLWSDSPEIGYKEKTAGAIIVLLVLLSILNIIAAWIRRKFEIKW